MNNLKKEGNIVTFDATGDETFQCKFDIMTGETDATTSNKFLLGMAKTKLLSVLIEKGELPSELTAMAY